MKAATTAGHSDLDSPFDLSLARYRIYACIILRSSQVWFTAFSSHIGFSAQKPRSFLGPFRYPSSSENGLIHFLMREQSMRDVVI